MPKSKSQPQAEHDSDAVWGASAIGAVIGRNRRQTFHLLENGLIPAKRVGKLWVGSRRRLLDHIATDDARGQP